MMNEDDGFGDKRNCDHDSLQLIMKIKMYNELFEYPSNEFDISKKPFITD